MESDSTLDRGPSRPVFFYNGILVEGEVHQFKKPTPMVPVRPSFVMGLDSVIIGDRTVVKNRRGGWKKSFDAFVDREVNRLPLKSPEFLREQGITLFPFEHLVNWRVHLVPRQGFGQSFLPDDPEWVEMMQCWEGAMTGSLGEGYAQQGVEEIQSGPSEGEGVLSEEEGSHTLAAGAEGDIMVTVVPTELMGVSDEDVAPVERAEEHEDTVVGLSSPSLEHGQELILPVKDPPEDTLYPPCAAVSPLLLPSMPEITASLECGEELKLPVKDPTSSIMARCVGVLESMVVLIAYCVIPPDMWGNA